MFLRWKKRKLPKPKYRNTARRQPDVLLSAVLVEAVRVEGKPRQRTVKYLGSVEQERARAASWGHLVGFWQSVGRNLDTLKLPRRERREIEGQIAAVAPKPTRGMRAAAFKRLRKLEG